MFHTFETNNKKQNCKSKLNSRTRPGRFPGTKTNAMELKIELKGKGLSERGEVRVRLGVEGSK